MTALIAAALALLEDCSDHQTPITKIKAARRLVNAAAWERLRLSRTPCETCGGTGNCGRLVDDFGYDAPVICGSCGGSGEVWPKELIRLLRNLRPMCNLESEEAIAALDALDLWAKEAK